MTESRLYFFIMKICFISKFDSFVRLALNYAIQFKRFNWKVTFIVLEKNKLSNSQISHLNNQLKIHQIKLEAYRKEILLESTAIFFCLTGGYIKKIIRSIISLTEKDRPYLISAYPGVVYRNIYDGFTSRSLCDLIIFPSFREKMLYERYCQEYRLTDSGIVGGYFKSKCPIGDNFANDVVFAEQTVVPNTISDRLYLARKLIEFAEKNHNKNLFIKPRIALSGTSLFETKLHILDALNTVTNKKLPDNLKITYEPIEYYTSQGATCATISSTAAIETLQFHDKIAFISDFGPSENNGGTYFRNSNVEYSFSELIAGHVRAINKEWKKQVYISNDKCIEKIIEKVEQETAHNIRPGYQNSRKLYSNEYLTSQELRVNSTKNAYRYIQTRFVKLLNLIKGIS